MIIIQLQYRPSLFLTNRSITSVYSDTIKTFQKAPMCLKSSTENWNKLSKKSARITGPMQEIAELLKQAYYPLYDAGVTFPLHFVKYMYRIWKVASQNHWVFHTVHISLRLKYLRKPTQMSRINICTPENFNKVYRRSRTNQPSMIISFPKVRIRYFL